MRLRRWHRDRVLEKALRELEALGEKPPTRDLLARLAYGFSNEGWAATLDLLDELVTRTRAAKHGILECGSGLSTLLFGALTKNRKDLPVVSLEHHPMWYGKMRKVLRHFGLRHVKLRRRALVSYGEFDWYAMPKLKPSRTFDLVLCDGPPGDTRGGRHGLLPCLRDRLAKNAVIIVDDTHRAEDDAVVTRWLETLPNAKRSRRGQFTILELS